MKTKNKKPILGVVALISLLVMAAALALGNPGITVASGGVFFVSLIFGLNRFIGDCESSIVDDHD